MRPVWEKWFAACASRAALSCARMPTMRHGARRARRHACFGASPGARTLTVRGKGTVLCHSSSRRVVVPDRMCLGVTGRSRTGTSGSTIRGSTAPLRPHPNTRLSGLGGRVRTCGLMIPNHARCQLRHTEKKRVDQNLASRDRFERPTCRVEAGCSDPLS